MYKFAGDWDTDVPQTHSKREIWAAKGLGITFLVLCGLWACTLVFLRRRINLAIGLVREAARAVIAMPFMMVYPFLQAAGTCVCMCVRLRWMAVWYIHAVLYTHTYTHLPQYHTGLLAFLVPWCVFSVYVAAMGRFEPRQFKGIGIDLLGQNPLITVQRFQYGATDAPFAWYMLFVLLWTAQFIVAVGQITLALAVSTWYFTRDKRAIGSGTLCRAMHVTTRYHLGTAAFGSLVIAVVEFIRAVIAWLQKKVCGDGGWWDGHVSVGSSSRSDLKYLPTPPTGASVGEQGRAVAPRWVPVLHVVPGERAQVRQQERLHPDGVCLCMVCCVCLGLPLLLLLGVCV